MNLYDWGGTTATTLNEINHAVHSHLADRLTKGPGWVIKHGDDCYDIELTIRLRKKPTKGRPTDYKPRTFLHGSGT